MVTKQGIAFGCAVAAWCAWLSWKVTSIEPSDWHSAPASVTDADCDRIAEAAAARVEKSIQKLVGDRPSGRTPVEPVKEGAARVDLSKLLGRLEENRKLLLQLLNAPNVQAAMAMQAAVRNKPEQDTPALYELARRYEAGEHEKLKAELRFLTGPQLLQRFGPPTVVHRRKEQSQMWSYIGDKWSFDFTLHHGYVISVTGGTSK